MNQSDILHAVNRLTYHRGERYFREGRVRQVLFDRFADGTFQLQGSVEGTEVYRQEITLKVQARGVTIRGNCTCPVGKNCKHVVAVCLQFVQQLESGENNASLSVVDSWMDALVHAGTVENAQSPKAARNPKFIAYVVDAPELNTRAPADEPARNGLTVTMRATRERANGDGLNKGTAVNPDTLRYNWDLHDLLCDADRLLVPLLSSSRRVHSGATLSVDRDNPTETMDRLLDSGRAFWRSLDGQKLSRGEPRRLHLEWTKHQDGYRLHAEAVPAAHVIVLKTPWYLDLERGEMGPVGQEHPLREAQWPLIFDAPTCSEEEALTISRRLLAEGPTLPVPPPIALNIDEIRDVSPTPCLRLFGRDTDESRIDLPARRLHAAELSFRYGPVAVDALPEASSITVSDGSRMVRVHRNLEAEQDAHETLTDLGLTAIPSTSGAQPFEVRSDNISLGAARWQELLEVEFPRLRSSGWEIESDTSFSLRFEDADLEGELESGTDWFALRYDVEVDGEKYPLAPLIAPLIESLMHRPLEEWPNKVPLHVEHGRFLRVPKERLRPAMEVLQELYNPDQLARMDLRRSRFEAAALAALDSDRAMRGARELIDLATRLRDFEGISAVPTPAGLKAELRPYQQQGVNWLQFLREYGFHGILADDMGLGKTLQTLTHLLIEKQAGRLDAPALVVAPTSLMGNWRREAERFTPDLRVMVMQGADRHRLVRKLKDADIILTTYPLLPRDADVLGAQSYHSVILDEAQNVKNPKTRAARVIRELKSRYRLCLTGTPMENHLGELWALFDFLMPGFLLDNRTFRERFRGPIENDRDPEVRRQLARRVQPFLLRRTKDAVVSELPPKTEIVRTVEFDRSQAQLYESIRVAMDKRVREAIAAQGLARSHITILDALLKLRQTCCDPRLLKMDAARNVSHSAKMTLLLEMLPELLEEGRRILLFSQFTQMLDLIEKDLNKQGIRYSKLTGQTRDRDEVIRQFTEGEVDVFLISLKAGGVGLNLAEADTVILYDPWWNPAVEAQAADRAHRIGQEKPVFVYKLVVENSVEETILGLQEHKRALAHSMYDGKDGSNEAAFEASDLQALFAPIVEA